MHKPEYNFGDLVHIEGYEARVFKVDSYRVEHCFTPKEEWTDIVYDLTDMKSGAYVECDEEDMRLADGEYAGEYAGDELDGTGIDIFDFMGGLSELGELYYEMEETKMAKNNERKPTARELSGQEAERRKQARKDRAAKVDALLDEMNDYKRLVAEFGDEEYKAKVEYLTIKLAEVSSEK